MIVLPDSCISRIAKLHLNHDFSPRTLDFSKTPITRTKSCFPWICFTVILPPIMELQIFRTNFRFPYWRFEKSGLHCVEAVWKCVFHLFFNRLLAIYMQCSNMDPKLSGQTSILVLLSDCIQVTFVNRETKKLNKFAILFWNPRGCGLLNCELRTLFMCRMYTLFIAVMNHRKAWSLACCLLNCHSVQGY